MQWGSIGWACPASFGYAMGLEPDRRLVSVIGDGSFQLTAQEVANMIRYGQETTIFLVNNRGYVVEWRDPRRPLQLLQELGLRRPDRCMERRRRSRAGPEGDHWQGAGRRHQPGPQAQGRPGADRMPDRPRRLQHPAARVGLKGRPRQRPPAPNHLIHTVVRTHSQAVHRPANVENSRRTQTIKDPIGSPAIRPLACCITGRPDRI